ncbi:MAG: RNA polymerase subunit sigma-24 [Nocardiopsaceae bacterium]|nr:RNA polymerase subunit sigma-24 [Nocardiopsaceae bacterium]
MTFSDTVSSTCYDYVYARRIRTGAQAAVASRICLDVLRSARARRESYVGEWLPEPLPGAPEGTAGAPGDPADRVTLDESVSMAFMVVLETMTPAERVAFVLHDVFRYPFTEVAEITGRTPVACRQLASSARRRVQDSRKAAPPASASRVVGKFRRALEAGDVRALIGLLDPDAVATSDGGGLVPAARHPVTGAEPIARFLAGLPAGARATLERMVNGQPGLVAMENGVAVTVFAFAVADDRITRIWAMRNPEKLRPWNP